MLLHKDHVYTQKLLDTDASVNSQFYLQFWRSNLISCERVAAAHSKSQFYFSFWRSNFISRETVGVDISKSQLYFSVFGDRTSFRAKGLAWTFQNRNFTSVFGDRTSFRAKGLPRHTPNRNFTSVFAIELHFVRKGCRGHFKIAILLQFLRSNCISCEKVVADISKSQFYCSFWRSNFVSRERIAFRAVSLALSRAFKREIERKEKARGQESKGARENVKM